MPVHGPSYTARVTSSSPAHTHSAYTPISGDVIDALARRPTMVVKRPRHLPLRRLRRGTTMYACFSGVRSGVQAASSQSYHLLLHFQVLPDSLGDALQQASEATALAIEKGANRCIVSCCTTYHSCPASRISCQHGFEHFLTSDFALRLRSCCLSSGIPLVDQSLLRKVISNDSGSSPAGSLTALHRAETARTSKL